MKPGIFNTAKRMRSLNEQSLRIRVSYVPRRKILEAVMDVVHKHPSPSLDFDFTGDEQHQAVDVRVVRGVYRVVGERIARPVLIVLVSETSTYGKS